jgi:hypothetical protein
MKTTSYTAEVNTLFSAALKEALNLPLNQFISRIESLCRDKEFGATMAQIQRHKMARIALDGVLQATKVHNPEMLAKQRLLLIQYTANPVCRFVMDNVQERPAECEALLLYVFRDAPLTYIY